MTKYDILDNIEIKPKITDFVNNNITKIHFFIPSIHCRTCLLILESLPKSNNKIIDLKVDFLNKTVWITFDNNKSQISDLAIILDNMGYPPSIDFFSVEKKKYNKNYRYNRNLISKIAISFFCFGNIMLLAIPEYVNAYQEDFWYQKNSYIFHYIMLFLSIPIVYLVFLDHIKPALIGLNKCIISIDIPIIIGVSVIFFWSCFEVIHNSNPGYFDSLSCFYLFILISKTLQKYTHDKIYSFKNDYKSFYPVLITKIKKNGLEKKILLSSLKRDDVILIRNEEIIPSDSILIKGKAILDNSFITGESYLVHKNIGDIIYSGSKQKGKAIYLKVIKNVDKSYLSTLWNSNKCIKNNLLIYSITNNLSKYFTPVVLIIAFLTGLYWGILYNDMYKVFKTTFSVLIITCPCAIILSAPIIFGNIINFFSKKGFYIRDIFVMEQFASCNTLIFDKTGTLTDTNKENIHFTGCLNKEENKIVISLLRNSTHPLSQKILSILPNTNNFYNIKDFKEIFGKGLKCIIKNGIKVKIGSPEYLDIKNKKDYNNKTVVSISINDKHLGDFEFRNYYRKGIKSIFKYLKKYEIIILSGDNNKLEKKYLKSLLPKSSKILFNQSPENKFQYIKYLKKNKKRKIIMLGDGINDCAALNISDVGISVSSSPTNFFPSCDAFMKSDYLYKIYLFLNISKVAKKLVIINFIISFLYNFVGIYFAVTGNITPFLSTILMPISSFSVIFFSIISTFIIENNNKIL